MLVNLIWHVTLNCEIFAPIFDLIKYVSTRRFYLYSYKNIFNELNFPGKKFSNGGLCFACLGYNFHPSKVGTKNGRQHQMETGERKKVDEKIRNESKG